MHNTTIHQMIARVDEIIEGNDDDSDAEWEKRFTAVFTFYRYVIDPFLKRNGIFFDYCDPDTTYREDTMALVQALHDKFDVCREEP